MLDVKERLVVDGMGFELIPRLTSKALNGFLSRQNHDNT